MTQIICGDCLKVMPTLAENSVDAIVTDPPYHLTQVSRKGSPRNNDPQTPFGRHHIGERGFMGKTWDGGGISFRPETWAECLRVAKPGAHLACFGGTRTFHRIACAIEDAGWILIDTICWTYGSGFPKSLNIGKVIDRKFGAEREVVGKYQLPNGDEWNLKQAEYNAPQEPGAAQKFSPGSFTASGRRTLDITAPATEAAKKWDGYGTALKPAWEPIILAMKPLDGTYAENALKWGVAGLNIDGCRVPTGDDLGRPAVYYTKGDPSKAHMDVRPWMQRKLDAGEPLRPEHPNTPLGRWPSNFSHDGSDEIIALFPQSNGQQGDLVNHNKKRNFNGIFGEMAPAVDHLKRGDTGSAARFFYCAKASASERSQGLDGERNGHPTVKPLALMSYLCRLITPRGGLILDPFAGSGSTGKAAIAEGFQFIGIEQELEYVEIAKKRCGLNGCKSLQDIFDEVVNHE
jgi:site-specific DNA-methyltransferase (adenine-specific)